MHSKKKHDIENPTLKQIKMKAIVNSKLPQIGLFSAIVLVSFGLSNCTFEMKQQESAIMSQEELIAAGEKLDSLYRIAFNNQDVDALMHLHWNSPELLSYPPGEQQVKGYDAIKAAYARDFAANKGAKMEYLSVVNVPFTDGIAGYGTYKWTMPVGDSLVTGEGRYSDIKAFKDGKLVIVFDHSSEPAASHE
jgi:ketosteroid isomerase-like protein